MGPEHDVLDISSDEEDATANGSGKNSHDYQSSLEQIVKLLELEDAPWASEEVIVVDELSCTSPAHKLNFTQSKMATADDSDDDDCMVLDGDPDKPIEVVQDEGNRSDELLIVGEKGQIACRDYPHSRHLCAMFPFGTTSHEKFCKLCHCYVCDIPAPCVYWGTGSSSVDHCHSSDKEENWRLLRKTSKSFNSAAENSERLPGCSIRPHGIRPQGMRTPATRTSHNNLSQRISSSSVHSGPSSVPCRTSVFLHVDSGSVPVQTSVFAHAGPTSVPRQNSDSRANMFRHCSTTSFCTPNIISQRRSHQSSIFYSNTQHLNRPQTFSGTYGTQGQWRGPSSQVAPVHSKGRTAGDGFINITAKRPRTSVTNQNQLPTQMYPRKLQKCPSFPTTLVDENYKKWQDILLGRDADLGTDFGQCTVYPQPVMYSQSCTQTSASTGTNLLSSSSLVTNNLTWMNATSADASVHVSLANSPLLNLQSINPYAVPENYPVSGEAPSGEAIGSLVQEVPQDTAGDQGLQGLNPHTYDEQEMWTS